VACLIASTAGVAVFTRWARRARLLDVPNERSSHNVPTPRGAGIVIVLVVIAAVAWSTGAAGAAGMAGAAALVIALISAIDDARPLPSVLRLIVHLACAVVAVFALTEDSHTVWRAGTIVVGILWIVSLTNAYNFMDGIDGISGAQAVVTGITVVVAGLRLDLNESAVAGAAIASANMGFLFFNWPPARVFMGDVGAAFLGFVFAVLTLRIGSVSFDAGVVVFLSLWPFVFDTTMTLLRRMARRENIFASHRSHLYQRLVIAGWPHAYVTAMYAVLAVLGSLAGLAFAGSTNIWLSIAAVSLLAAGTYVTVLRAEASGKSPRDGGADVVLR
jgi:UDP-N-acetylmuramyl pentapeptide phosphotransferase/UDP-N-acetylglucosamine-1-phosphate transferase